MIGDVNDRPVLALEAAGVLFDLDGVLVDSTAVVERHWRQLAATLGLDADGLLAGVHGRRSADTIRGLAARVGGVDVESLVADFEQSEATDLDGLVALPGAAAALAELPPERWAVVTSGTAVIAGARLGAAGLPRPHHLVTADDVADGKPHPAPYLRGAALLGIDPVACLAVEDAPAGLASAVAAGCRTLALRTTHDADQLAAADHTAADLAHVRLRLRA